MGVVQRQTIKNNLISYLAVVVGVISSLYIYPLNLELKGYAEGLIKLAALLMPFFNLGLTSVIIRFGAYLEGGPAYATAQLLSRSVVIVTGLLFFSVLCNYFFGDQSAAYFIEKGYNLGLLADRRWEIICLVSFMSYSGILTAALINHHRIAIPVVFNNLLVKIGIPSIILAVVYGVVPESAFVPLLVILHALVLMCLIVYYGKIAGYNWTWKKLTFQEKSLSDLISLAGFALVGSIGSVLATQIDIISVNTFLGNYDTGVYSFAVFVTMIIAISYKALGAITGPTISKAWKEGDLEKMEEVYKDAGQSLFAVGGLIYAGAVVCLPFVYAFTDKTGQYSVGYTAAVLLGAGQLIEQATSINNVLIGYSDYYRWNVLFVVFLGGLNLALNYFFIVAMGYGLTGAAISTMISIGLFNLIKVTFIYWKMGIHPFSVSMVYSTMALACCALLSYVLPPTGYPYLDVFIKGGTILLAFYLFVRYTNGVPVLRRALNDGIKNIW